MRQVCHGGVEREDAEPGHDGVDDPPLPGLEEVDGRHELVLAVPGGKERGHVRRRGSISGVIYLP